MCQTGVMLGKIVLHVAFQHSNISEFPGVLCHPIPASQDADICTRCESKNEVDKEIPLKDPS